MTIRSVAIEDEASWSEELGKMPHDIYHTAAYQRLAGKQEDGRPVLLVGEYGKARIAIPLLIREIADSQIAAAKGLSDASSAYGYPGLICNSEARKLAIAHDFSSALRAMLENEGIVSVFLRQNPVLGNDALVVPPFEPRGSGETVLLDLTKSLEEQRKAARGTHLRDYRKSLEAGLQVVADKEFSNIEWFIETYHKTMSIVGASEKYFFAREYFEDLIDNLKSGVKLCLALFDGKPIGGALFFLHRNIIQYHLSCTAPEFYRLSPNRAILEWMREWGTEQQFKWFHLGGGAGGASDSLLRFKRGFGKSTREFVTGRLIVSRAEYENLVAEARGGRPEACAQADDFFPEYRRGS